MNSAQCYLPWGLQIVNGEVINEPQTGTGTYLNSKGETKEYDKSNYSNWFGITKDGKPVIGDLETYNNDYKGKDLLQYGVSGSKMLVKNGEYQALSGGHDARTAIGINANGDIVMVAVGGNNESADHKGVTFADLAQVFMNLDMDITYALNLDGGSSTTMLYRSSDGEFIRRTNFYNKDDTKHENEREITDVLVIVAG